MLRLSGRQDTRPHINNPSPQETAMPLPQQWPRVVQAATIHLMALAHYVLVATRSWAANSVLERVRLAAQVDQLDEEVRLLREEGRIKDTRSAHVPPAQRPHYGPTERLAILELRALRGWSLAQTASVFQVTPATIAAWTKRLDEEGPNALLRTREPVNKFPDFVRYLVQRLQTLCPRLGKVKIAQMLARAGLHLAATTIGRMRREPPVPAPAARPSARVMPSASRVTADYVHHVWHVDLTTVPTTAGFWTSWLPFALPQRWPFCWWLAVALDHFSRRVVGFTVFTQQPTSEQVRRWLGRVVGKVGAAPRYLVTDQGEQFVSAGFRHWCRRHGVRQRLGAVGKQGSIAVVERFIRTLKDECARVLTAVPLVRRSFQREIHHFIGWYNESRPHMTLGGATPNEVCFGNRPANRNPRFETRPNWPRAAPCAKPQTLIKGQPGTQVEATVQFQACRRHLPLVTIARAA
jgi:transposase InsO family protein